MDPNHPDAKHCLATEDLLGSLSLLHLKSTLQTGIAAGWKVWLSSF